MLSYRHGFHVGNHADVLKHLTLVACLRAMARKETPYLYADTHAGAGAYALEEGYAAQNREWAQGVARLAPASPIDATGPLAASTRSDEPEAAGDAPEAVLDYLSVLRSLGYGDGRYPGSPAIAAALSRPGDRLALFELHPADHEALSALTAPDRRASVAKADGFSGLKGLLPPASRRGLVVIDPSYELASDYDKVVDALADALRRFATGCYLVWYPLLERPEAKALPGRLRLLASPDGKAAKGLAASALDARLRVRAGAPGERGMAGSGVLALNPPWTLRPALESALPWLAARLGQDAGAGWSLE